MRRASDAGRDAAGQLLRQGLVEGRLSIDTYELRIERVLAARTVFELRSLIADLSAPGTLARMARGLRSAVMGAVVPGPTIVARLDLRSVPDDGIVLGRHATCDLRLDDVSVSRRHGRLRKVGTRWRYEDLESTNGSWHNRAAVRDAIVRPGDVLTLGDVAVQLLGVP